MDTFLTDMLNRLGPLDIVLLLVGGIVLLYLALSNRVLPLMFMLILSASLVTSTIPIIENVASLLRWLCVLLLLVAGLLFSKVQLSVGTLLFWGYVFFGLAAMIQALSITWQLQRGLLLLLVATAVPIVYGARSYATHRATLVATAVAGAMFGILNAVALPSQLSSVGRSIGFAQTAPGLTVAMGSLLPFVFWGFWNVRTLVVRVFFGIGFLAGVATLVLSGQRAGTLAGIVSVIPMVFMLVRRKQSSAQLVLLLIVLAVLGLVVIQNTNPEKINYVLNRYRPDTGLTNRDWLWSIAYSEISKNPLFGQGIGAAESVILASFHNAYLEVWFNAGFIGLALFIASQLYLLFRIRCLSRILPGPEAQSILALALGYLMGFVLLCIVESVGAGASNLSLILFLYLGTLVSGHALFGIPGCGAGMPTATRTNSSVAWDVPTAITS